MLVKELRCRKMERLALKLMIYLNEGNIENEQCYNTIFVLNCMALQSYSNLIQFTYICRMRKTWTPQEDTQLRKILAETGTEDWTDVANKLHQKNHLISRTGKQCRERWYNHLDPNVNKGNWTYAEELLLFELHKELGNKWKQMSVRLKGRTDNNIKNHFYSTLRRSLRRLNKMVGEKNSTLSMRQIKPSVLNLILNFIYDHQIQNQYNQGQFIEELKDLPKLIFEFAEFKPIKGNINQSLKLQCQAQVQTIFRLVADFNQSYKMQKSQKKKVENYHYMHESRQYSQEAIPSLNSGFNQSKFMIISMKEEEVLQSTEMKMQQSDKGEENMFERDQNDNMLQLQEPSPLTYMNQDNPYPELIVIGRHWSPKKEQMQFKQMDIDQILVINYES